MFESLFSADQLLALAIFVLPAYVANAVPVIFGGGAPMDSGGKAWDGRRALGDGKTWRGFISGMAFGTLTGIAEANLIGDPEFVTVGFMLAYGAMVGDLLGSFVKRRMGMPPGASAFLLDQLPFLAVALLAASPLRVLAWGQIVFLAVATYFLHAGTNFAANRIGLKKVPW